MATRILPSIATVSGFTLLSRLFGFARQVLITGVIGASGSPVADAFWAAFRLPNMFRRLLAEGAFQAAFIPLFQRHQVEGGDEAAKEFAENVLAWLIFILTLLSALVMICAPLFVILLAYGFRTDPEKFDLTVLYTRVMFPYLACMSLVGLCGGILNAMHKFMAAAAAPLALNICLIVAVLYFARAPVEITGLAASWAVLAGGIAQLVILIIGAARSGFLLRLKWPRANAAIRRLVILGMPGFIGAGALQINTIIGTNIASRERGAVSWLMNADQLYQLPLAVVGIALSVVLMPAMSRSLKEGKPEEARYKLNRGIELGALFALPAAIALVLMPVLICSALYTDFAGDALRLVGANRSAFTLFDATQTGRALMIFGLGLPAFVLHKILAAAFFARENTKTPMQFALLAIVINISLSLILFPKIGYIAVPIATISAAWVEVMALGFMLLRAGALRPDRRLFARLPRLAASAGLMGGFIAIVLDYERYFTALGFGQSWLFLAGLTLASMGVYGVCAQLLRAVSLRDLKA